MKIYKVKITETALTAMEQIYDYIADVLQSPENAMGQYNRIAKAIGKLEQMPERFPVIDLEWENARGLRRMLVDRYSVFYVISEENVIVVDVLYSASDIGRRLQE